MKKLLSSFAALALLASPAMATEATHDHAADAATHAEAEVTATSVVVEGEHAFVVDATGTKTPAPDGEHKLADGTTVKTVGGKVAK